MVIGAKEFLASKTTPSEIKVFMGFRKKHYI